jgi:hypothetical protein
MAVRLKTFSMFVIFLLVPLSTLQADAITTGKEISFLMGCVESSPCRFFRNKKEYDGPRALEHILLKYKHYQKKIITAEDFIAYCATKSLMSGKEYMVECADQPRMPLGEWLQAQLLLYRAQEEARSLNATSMDGE